MSTGDQVTGEKIKDKEGFAFGYLATFRILHQAKGEPLLRAVTVVRRGSGFEHVTAEIQLKRLIRWLVADPERAELVADALALERAQRLGAVVKKNSRNKGNESTQA